MAKNAIKHRTKRQENLKRKRQYQERLAKADRFPTVVIEPGEAPDTLVQAVRERVKELRFHYDRLLPQPLTELFLMARQVGFGPLLGIIRLADTRPWTSDLTLSQFGFLMSLGEFVQSSLPDGVRQTYLPYHCLEVEYGQPAATMVRIRFKSLRQARTSGGTAYYSPFQPTLSLRGQEYGVAFYRHAAERICERTVANWESYAGSGDAFAFLYNCVYFEDCSPFPDLPWFTLYERCQPGFMSTSYAEAVRGTLDPGRSYYYRVGYCPAVTERDLVIAKTLLLPGMRGTPEYQMIRRSHLPESLKREFAEQAEHLTARELVQSQDFSLLKWFHDRGIPQVVTFDHEVFRDD